MIQSSPYEPVFKDGLGLHFHFGIKARGVCGAVWFDFNVKSHLNRKVKKYAVWFGLVDFENKIRTKPMLFGSFRQ